MPRIKGAISAWYLRENNPHHLISQPSSFLPFQIWYLKQPCQPALRIVLAECPQVKYPVAHAYMVANYWVLCDELDIIPNAELQDHAKNYPNPYFKEDLARRAAKLEETRKTDPEAWQAAVRQVMRDPRARSFVGFSYELSRAEVGDGATPLSVETDWDHGPYDGLRAEVDRVGLYVCAPDSLKNYVFQKDAGPMSSVYWKSEEEMHKNLGDDGEAELSNRLKKMAVMDAGEES